jgi:hypothetical protein
MITKSDWEAVRQRMSDQDRRNLGEPPTADEVLAYSKRELSETDAARVRTWLVGDPELARALIAPFPTDDARPGDDAFLSYSELTTEWKSLQARIHGPGSEVEAASGRRLKFPERWIVLAAAIALVFAGLLWQAESKVRRLDRELNGPRVLHAAHQLEPDSGRRGAPEESTLTAVKGENVLLELPLSGSSRFKQYRVQIADARAVPARSLWKSPAIDAEEDEPISVLISGDYFETGKYRIVVYGVSGASEEPLDSYTVHVVRR